MTRRTTSEASPIPGLTDPRVYRYLMRCASGVEDPEGRQDAEAVVCAFFGVGREVVGSDSAFGIWLGGARECLSTWLPEYRREQRLPALGAAADDRSAPSPAAAGSTHASPTSEASAPGAEPR